MEYNFSRTNTESRARIALSSFTAEGCGAPEFHAIITLPDSSEESPESQLDHIGQAARQLISELGTYGARPVMARWLLSDTANLAHLLTALTPEPIAVSIVGQTPLNGSHAALWLYFMAASKVERADEFTVVATRNHRQHIFTASSSLDEPDSYAATSLLLSNYNGQLNVLDTSLASGCIRTWFFIRDIDYFYSGVVRGRNEVFSEIGLTPSTHFIASTGIEGKPGNARVTVTMDAWAVTGLTDEQISYIQAPTHLNPTHEYGVAFERATAIDYADRRHLIISGTASIDSNGQIVSPGDIIGQTHRMIDNVEALLRNGKAKWNDVAYIIIYLRNIAHRTAVERILEDRFPENVSAPRIIVEAPVCRPGWLIEMECMAIAPASDTRYEPF